MATPKPCVLVHALECRFKRQGSLLSVRRTIKRQNLALGNQGLQRKRRERPHATRGQELARPSGFFCHMVSHDTGVFLQALLSPTTRCIKTSCENWQGQATGNSFAMLSLRCDWASRRGGDRTGATALGARRDHTASGNSDACRLNVCWHEAGVPNLCSM